MNIKVNIKAKANNIIIKKIMNMINITKIINSKHLTNKKSKIYILETKIVKKYKIVKEPV